MQKAMLDEAETNPVNGDPDQYSEAELQGAYAGYVTNVGYKSLTVEMLRGITDDATIQRHVEEMELQEAYARGVVKLLQDRGWQVPALEPYDSDAPWRMRAKPASIN